MFIIVVIVSRGVAFVLPSTCFVVTSDARSPLARLKSPTLFHPIVNMEQIWF